MQFLILREIPLKQKEVSLFSETPKETLYTEVPKMYDKLSWPKETNLPCYMCTIVTKRKPFFVPSIITSDGRINRGINQIVCSPACAMSWILYKANDESENRRYTSYVQELLYVMTGYKVKIIEKSLDRSELKKFGGTLTDHQYQREIIISSGDYIEKLYASKQDYENDLS
jgi:hypothetical protein